MYKQIFKSPPDVILKKVLSSKRSRHANISGIEFLIDPEVFPSDQFRTTNFLINHLKPYLKGSSVCDMGCGAGVIGVYALYEQSKRVLSADINPFAVQNAQKNFMYHHFESGKFEVVQSDCFDAFKKQQKFDLIIFNIPFHSDPVSITKPREYAIYDPGFRSLKKFLTQAKSYLNEKGVIIIPFSNKGDTKLLERLFQKHGYNWILKTILNEDQAFDNRIYHLT